MSGPGAIVGRVVDGLGKPVHGATVALTESPEPHPDVAALTAADGRFQFRHLPPGAYRLAVNAPNSRRSNAQVWVEAGTEASVEINLDG